jgi:glycerol transport system ATP-binding protein
LGAGYGPIQGRVQIGVRPEFCRLTAGQGLPVRILRVEDVGRHRIIRAEAAGQPVNIIAPEGRALATDLTYVAFDPAGINVYADDWRVAPLAPQERAA